MFNNDITLTDGTTSTTYSLTSIVNGKSIRAQATAATGAPRVMTISHQPKNATATAPTRHMVRLDYTKTDSLGIQATVSAYLVVEEPQAQFTAAEVTEVIAELHSFYATPANVVKLLNDEP